MARCKHEKALDELTDKVCQSLKGLDEAMKRDSDFRRGHLIAQIQNYLEMANDSAMHFDLGWDWKKINNRKQNPGRASDKP